MGCKLHLSLACKITNQRISFKAISEISLEKYSNTLHEHCERVFLLLYLYFLLSRKVARTGPSWFIENHLALTKSTWIATEQVMKVELAVVAHLASMLHVILVKSYPQTKVVASCFHCFDSLISCIQGLYSNQASMP